MPPARPPARPPAIRGAPQRTPWKAVAQLAIWPLMGVITFFFASLPALHAQVKLARGKGLVYRVAEKGSRKVAVPAAEHHHHLPEPAAEPFGAAGGGGGA